MNLASRLSLKENGPTAISLSAAELERFSSAVPTGSVAGERYPERGMAIINR